MTQLDDEDLRYLADIVSELRVLRVRLETLRVLCEKNGLFAHDDFETVYAEGFRDHQEKMQEIMTEETTAQAMRKLLKTPAEPQ